MKRFMAFLPFLFAAVAARGDGLTVSVSAREVVTGDPFQIVAEWRGSASPIGVPSFSNPDAAPLAGPQTSSRYSNVNGRVSQSLGWIWTARVDEPGVVDFGEVRLAVDGKLYTAVVPKIVVGPPPPQPFVRLSLASDKSEVLVEEDFAVTLSVDVAAPTAPEGSGQLSPLDPARAPLLRIPHLGGDADPGPCRPESDPAEVLQRFVARDGTPGFRVNSFARREDPFESMGFGGFGGGFPSMFGESRPVVFAFPREAFSENGTNFVRYSVSARFRASAEGECRFPPARFEGSVVRSAGRGGRPASLSRPVVALSGPLSVKVVPPPREGRPDSFFGALGTSLSPSVSLDAQTCRQGDPLSLSLRLEGDLVPSTVRAPDVFASPAMSELFRAWGEPERHDDGGVPVFSYRVRPLVSGTLEVPAIELSFFDTASRSYRTVSTAPVPLRVDPVADFDPSALFAAASEKTSLALSAPATGPVAPSLSLDPAGAEPRPVPGRAAVAAFAAVPPLRWLPSVLSPFLPGTVRRASGTARRGGAARRAASRLKSAENPQEVLDAVRTLLRDRWGEDVPGLTPSDLDDFLARRGAPEDARREAVALLQETFDEAFRPGADVRAAVRGRRGRLAEALLAALRVLPPLVLLAASAPSALADADPAAADAAFLWNRAAASAARAAKPEDFLPAARDYRAIAAASGAPSAALLTNLGATLLQAGCREEALDAFARAEAVGGANAWTESGTALASGADPSWTRVVLAWHWRVPLSVRRAALAAAWCAFWLLLALGRLSRRRPAFVLAAAAAAVCAVLGASVLSSERLLSSPLPQVPESVPAVEVSP